MANVINAVPDGAAKNEPPARAAPVHTARRETRPVGMRAWLAEEARAAEEVTRLGRVQAGATEVETAEEVQKKYPAPRRRRGSPLNDASEEAAQRRVESEAEAAKARANEEAKRAAKLVAQDAKAKSRGEKAMKKALAARAEADNVTKRKAAAVKAAALIVLDHAPARSSPRAHKASTCPFPSVAFDGYGFSHNGVAEGEGVAHNGATGRADLCP